MPLAPFSAGQLFSTSVVAGNLQPHTHLFDEKKIVYAG